MLFNRCLVYLKYSCSKKRAKNVQKRAKTCKNVHLKYSFYQKRASQVLIYQKTCKNVYLKRKISKNVLLKYFWTQFKIVHCQGPCSLRPCISRPYCIANSNKSELWNRLSYRGLSYFFEVGNRTYAYEILLLFMVSIPKEVLHVHYMSFLCKLY